MALIVAIEFKFVKLMIEFHELVILAKHCDSKIAGYLNNL